MIGRAQAMATGRREPPFAHGVEARGHLRTPAGVAPSERPVANRSPRTPGDERPPASGPIANRRSRTAGREPPVANRRPRTADPNSRSERPVSGRASRGRRIAHRAARAGRIVATHAAPRPFVGRPAGSGRARPDRPLAPPARRPELSRTADTGRDAAPCPDS
nr:hypothetical protein X990_5642 [Burkholderia pseudomallei MSHR4868]